MVKTLQVAFDRDRQANWYARRHLDIDEGVERIFYLPTNAPPREIRFVEINRMIAETASPEPIDFGVGNGNDDAHTLYILDVTPAQWALVESGKKPLPHDWTLDGHQEFERG